MRTPPLVLSLLLLALPLTADLVTPQTSAPLIVIPVAGDAPGANGTYFRSDITVVNLRDIAQAVQFRWMPQGGGAGAVVTLTLNPRSGVISEDFVRNFLGQTGIGAIQIAAVGQDGAPDPNGRLHAAARIWTPVPNDPAGGTMSQSFPAIVVDNVVTNLKWVLGVRRDERYRLNVGVANPSPIAMRFRITAVSPTGTTESTEIDVPAAAMQQVPAPGTGAVAQIIIQNVTGVLPGVPWHGWASSVDNISGDAWSQSAFIAPAP